jgi:hypothetical protein
MPEPVDETKIQVTLDIHATSEKIWNVISDINMPAKFSDEFLGAQWLDGLDGPVLHARFTGKNAKPPMGEWETLSVVTALEQGTTFEWSVFDAVGTFSDIPVDKQQPIAIWRFDIQQRDEGCLLFYTATLGLGDSGLSRVLRLKPENRPEILARRMQAWRTNMEATLAGIQSIIFQ